MVTRKREAVEKFETSNKTTEVYRMGETCNDLQLTCKGFSEEDGKFLDEIEARGLEAYIYSAVPGSLLQHCPLTRGINGDPVNGTYVGTLASGTTVYMLRGDTSSLVYLEETDFANNAILANGMMHHRPNVTDVSKDLPLGRGVVILSAAKNMIKNSLFADSGAAVYNWTQSGGVPMSRMKTAGWMGVRELWLWGAAENWISDSMSLATLVDGDEIAISFGWRTDGIIKYTVTWNDGVGTTITFYSVNNGCGYHQRQFIIPTGYGGIGCSMTLKFDLPSGFFGGICAPQIVLGDTAYNGKREYPAFIGGSGNGIQGEITAQSLKFTGEWQAGMWSDAAGGSDSVLCAAGFVQPMFSEMFDSSGHRVFVFENSVGKELECYIQVTGFVVYLHISADGTWLDSTAITGFADGDVLFIALSVGWKDGVAHKKAEVRIVGGNTTFTAEHGGTAQFFTMYDTLWVGCDENQNEQADCLFQGVDIWAGREEDITTMVENMADPANLMEYRETLGRLYHIENHLNPNPYNRQMLDGTITCLNTRVL
jgi:hypothetical protein